MSLSDLPLASGREPGRYLNGSAGFFAAMAITGDDPSSS
jgi:hypothetical protein